LIDRVVKTWRGLGYFADPDSAEIFEHELAWMLLRRTSRSTRQSGSRRYGIPQQVSACFILRG
jgi:ribonucleoside-diphosphate reductase alpha chain